MLSTWEAIILGIVQGATEFLPVSSSGHLALTQQLFGLENAPLLYDVLLHVATLLATVVVLRRQVKDLIVALFRMPQFLKLLFQKGHLAIGDDPAAWTVILIVLSTFGTSLTR